MWSGDHGSGHPPDSIQVASDPCGAYGYKGDFVVENAAELDSLLRESEFEAIIFYATLERYMRNGAWR